jgi:hypothetical protein
MRLLVRIVLGCAIALAISGIVMLAWVLIMGQATQYCPWRHWLSDTSSCMVLDRKGIRILIQHADLDSNEYSFEVREGSYSQFYKFADGIERLAPEGYSGRLIGTESGVILLDGRRYELEPLESR